MASKPKHPPVGLAGRRESIAWLLYRRRCFCVEGDSMAPALAHGDEVLVAPHRPVAVGDVVVFAHPFVGQSWLVKRVSSIDDGRAYVLGDNPSQSTDSRSFGAIALANIIGPVTSKLPPESAD